MQPKKPQHQTLKVRPKHIRAKEWKRLQGLHLFENEALQKGFRSIAGVDEAGRGPLAGPVVAAACLIPEDHYIVDVNDSKQLTAKRRSELFEQITNDPKIIYGIGLATNCEIDSINIFQATIQAMLRAVAQLTQQPDYLLVDGLNLPHPSIPTHKIIQGDEKSHCIAAASVLAKEYRDRLMKKEHDKWPQYGFINHMGYGTPEHLAALKEHGPCELHRFSFSPIKNQFTSHFDH